MSLAVEAKSVLRTGAKSAILDCLVFMLSYYVATATHWLLFQ